MNYLLRFTLTVLIAWGCQQLLLPNVVAADAAMLCVVLYGLGEEGRLAPLALLLVAFFTDALTADRLPATTIAAVGANVWYFLSSLATTSWQAPLRRFLTLLGVSLVWHTLRLGLLAAAWLIYGSAVPRYVSVLQVLTIVAVAIGGWFVGEGWYKLRAAHWKIPRYVGTS